MTTSPRTALAFAASRAVALAARASSSADTRRAAREALGVARLSPAQAAEVDRVAALAWSRVARGPIASPVDLPIADGLRARALDRIRPAVRAAYSECGYRRAEGTWAGGDHEVYVCEAGNVAPFAEWYTRRAWSRNGKWSGLDSVHTLHVRATWDRRVLALGCAVVSGLLTLDADLVECAPGTRRAVWVEQGRGTSLRTVHGYLVRRADGSWAHADTERAARAMLSAPTRKPVADVSALDAASILRRARCAPGVAITLTSAPVPGRICAAGVRDWAARHGLTDRASVTAREIADVAAASHDRTAEVLIVLRAAGMRARAAQSIAA